MIYELQVWWLMLILNQRSIGGWEVLALTFMYTFYPKSLYQVVVFFFRICKFLSLFIFNGLNREVLQKLDALSG
jgi:hypothetical protein